MNGENVKKWRLLSEDGMTNVHEEQRSGRNFFLSRKIWKKRTMQNLGKAGDSQFLNYTKLFPAVFRCPK